MSKTATLANVILNYCCRATTPSALTPYLGFLTAVETPTEPSGNNYARVALSTSNFGSVAASNSIANTAVINSPVASGSWGTIVGVAIFDASSGGNALRKAYLTSGSYRVFTALASTDILTAPGHSFVNGDQVVVLGLTGTSLPTGLTQGTLYYVIGSSTDTLQLSTSAGGAAINLTANGGGRIVKVVPQAVGASGLLSFPVGTLIFTET